MGAAECGLFGCRGVRTFWVPRSADFLVGGRVGDAGWPGEADGWVIYNAPPRRGAGESLVLPLLFLLKWQRALAPAPPGLFLMCR